MEKGEGGGGGGALHLRVMACCKYYFSENKTIDSGLILESRVNW